MLLVVVCKNHTSNSISHATSSFAPPLNCWLNFKHRPNHFDQLMPKVNFSPIVKIASKRHEWSVTTEASIELVHHFFPLISRKYSGRKEIGAKSLETIFFSMIPKLKRSSISF